MMVIRILLALLVPFLLGYSLLLYLFKKNELVFLERMAISFVLGSGLLTFVMTLFVLFRIPLNFLVIVVFPVLFILFSLFKFRDNMVFGFDAMKTVTFGFGFARVLFFGLLFLIALKLCYVFSEALLRPVYTWDAMQNWVIRAKFIFYERVPQNIYNTDYPLHLPLIVSWFSIVLGEWNDQLYKVIFPLYYSSMLGSFYFVLRRFKGQLHSIFFTFLLSTLPLLAYHATISYADFSVAVFFYFAVAYLYVFMEKRGEGCFYLAALFAGMMMLVKSEGRLYFFALLFVLAIYLLREQRQIKPILKFFFPALLLILPWIIIRTTFGIKGFDWLFPETYYSISQLIGRFWFILQQVYKKFLFEGNWHLAWFAFVLSFLAFYKKIFQSKLKYLYLLTLLNLIVLFIVFCFTEMYQWLLGASVTFNRLVLAYMPIVLLTIGLTFKFSSKEKS
ncbi:MAG: glycosyltransferase family 39 protein [Candidatus Saganbacteria bacterium]|nr:glycosyltransferase family 39 protein [Candidatus Saganbacteria bacterium]